jgi:lipid-binding SYLF domain-containing protein
MMTALVLVTASAAAAASSNDETKRVTDAASVLREAGSSPDRAIPEDIWQRARCVVVIPGVKKAAFIFGGEFGKGVVSCRRPIGWSAPAFMKLERGSWGAQIGAESTDVVLLVMNDGGIAKLLQDKVTLGADASLSAGPVGRNGTASTDAQLHAEMLSYSHSRGLFAGIDLSGGVLRPDDSADASLYGHPIAARQILQENGQTRWPAAARPLMAALDNMSRQSVAKHGA